MAESEESKTEDNYAEGLSAFEEALVKLMEMEHMVEGEDTVEETPSVGRISESYVGDS